MGNGGQILEEADRLPAVLLLKLVNQQRAKMAQRAKR